MTSSRNCEICNISKYKYHCPKCNIIFCSAKCYNDPKHQACSEKFYKSCVQEEFTLRATEDADCEGKAHQKAEMYKILNRISDEGVNKNLEEEILQPDEESFEESGNEDGIDSDDEAEVEILSSRLEGVNLDNPDDVWSKLTEAEKREFETLIETGNITKILPEFHPWWGNKLDITLIEDITETTSLEIDKTKGNNTKYPEIKENIVSFQSLKKKPPADCIYNNIWNVFAAYICIVRFYIGEHNTQPENFAIYLINISLNLRNNTNFDHKVQSVYSVINESTTFGCLPILTDPYSVIKRDLDSITEGRYKGGYENVYMLAALSDIHSIFSNVLQFQNKCGNNRGFTKLHEEFSKMQIPNNFEYLTKHKLKHVLKKLEYYLSFVSCNYLSFLN